MSQTIHGVTYQGYDENRIERFMLAARRKRAHNKLRDQLEVAYKRGFSSTKIPLDVLRDLLAETAPF